MAALHGYSALVIGGASGMGRASAQKLAKLGAAVIIADINEEAAIRAAGEMCREGLSVVGRRVDLASVADLRAMFADLREPGLDTLFINAGIVGPDTIDMSEDRFDEVINVNVKGFYYATTLAASLMANRDGRGSIIYMSSGAGLQYLGGRPLYSISKSAILMMARSFAKELGPVGIRVNALCPGPVRTSFFGQGGEQPDERTLEWTRKIPLGRVANPEDVARLVAFLASAEASYLTGLAIPVDGGLFC